MLEGDNINVTIADTGTKALELLAANIYDTIIVDYTLPDISGMDLISKINLGQNLLVPIIVYSAKDFTSSELSQLNKMSSSIVLKDVSSMDRLLEETMTYLHINYATLSADKRKMMENIRMKNDILSRKKVMVVDDDVRNLFAITTVFERYNIDVITAESGKEAIELVINPANNIEMVLMDIMMPEMDGYETMQKIRREHKNNTLPIIAVTAKAMKGDRQEMFRSRCVRLLHKTIEDGSAVVDDENLVL